MFLHFFIADGKINCAFEITLLSRNFTCSISHKRQNTALWSANWIIAVIADVTVSIDNNSWCSRQFETASYKLKFQLILVQTLWYKLQYYIRLKIQYKPSIWNSSKTWSIKIYFQMPFEYILFRIYSYTQLFINK